MAHGFMYLTAIIDVYSRAIMAWGLHNSLDAENSIEVLQLAIASHGKPEIINSDQGSQYTCPAWEKSCEGIQISMDGRHRCLDNVWIERFWRTIKREYVYINPTDNVKELREGIKDYIEYYNTKRPHQGIEHQIPMTKYAKTQHDEKNVTNYLPVPQRMITFASPKEWTMVTHYTVEP